MIRSWDDKPHFSVRKVKLLHNLHKFNSTRVYLSSKDKGYTVFFYIRCAATWGGWFPGAIRLFF